MPSFPKYRGELPDCLNSFNLRHYWLVAYWVYFRPLGLQAYAYQAAPDCYRLRGLNKIRRTWNIPAYRNFYLMGLVSVFMFFLLIGGVFLWFQIAWVTHSGPISDVEFSPSGDRIATIGSDGTARLWDTKVNQKISFQWQQNRLVVFLLLSVFLLGLSPIISAFSLGIGRLIMGIEWNSMGRLMGLGYCLLLSSVMSCTWHLAMASPGFNLYGIPRLSSEFNIMFSLTVGFLFSTIIDLSLSGGNRKASRTVLSFIWGTSISTIIVIIVIVRFEIVSSSILLFFPALGAFVGSSRLALYPFEFALALKSKFKKSSHPLMWDQQSVFSLPGASQLLNQHLQNHEEDGLEQICTMAHNPYHRSTIQRSLRTYLHQRTTPLHLIYSFLDNKKFESYAVIPSNHKDWQQLPTSGQYTLNAFVDAKVFLPEQTILLRIIRQWRKLISEAGGVIGRAEDLEPIANPYVVGNPVMGDLFVGREDKLLRLEELWMQSGQCASVILYGHRRMGKSSILKNLSNRFDSQTRIIDFNMQLVGHVVNTGELLHNLALAIYDSLTTSQQNQLQEPEEDKFLRASPYTPFRRWITKLDPIRNGQRFIITIDEFELIEDMIKQGNVDPRLLDYFRGLIQTCPWPILAFAGLHTLQEMTEDYWNPLFGSVTAINVSFLSPKSAEHLLTQPSPDFPIDYDPDALQQIIQLTNGQPYLTQLIGHTLVTRFNRQTVEDGIERDRRFTLQDVETVINSPEFYRDGNAYFTGVWNQAQMSHPAGQTTILQCLCHGSSSLEQIVEQTKMPCEQTKAGLNTLINHDIVTENDGLYTFTIDLMPRWMLKYQSHL